MLRIRPDGSLREVAGSPVWSGGVEPVSIAVNGGLVYVAIEGNKIAGAESNYTGFTLNAGGQLTPIKRSTFGLSAPPTLATSFSTRPAAT